MKLSPDESPKFSVKNVVFIGAGFVGGPSAAVLASHVEDLNVTVVDLNRERIQAWNTDDLPVHEPGLLNLIRPIRIGGKQSEVNCDRNPPHFPRRRNLQFTTEIDNFIRQADIIFLCVDTPSRLDSAKHESAPDLTSLQKAVHHISEVVEKDFILVEKSTVPAGTAKFIENILSSKIRTHINFEVVSNPEFLAEGKAIRDLEYPARVLIGCSGTVAGLHAAELIGQLYEHWVPRENIVMSDTWSSELAKLCSNALLAQRISSINSISMICERLGADVREVSKIAGLDPRIGPHMLSASVGFGGSCFQKDVAHLVYLARRLGLEEVASYWRSVLQINQLQRESFAQRINQKLALCQPNTVQDIAVLGYAFKAETNDVRNSPAIDITRELMQKHNLRIYDPRVSGATILASLKPSDDLEADFERKAVVICSTVYEACQSASAVVVLTEWNEFQYHSNNATKPSPDYPRSNSRDSWCVSRRSSDSGIDHSPTRADLAMVDWPRVADSMRYPKYLFDGRNIVDDSIAELGFQVERIGKRSSGEPHSYL